MSQEDWSGVANGVGCTSMRDRVRFLLGHELVELDRVDPTQTVLDWLRLERRRTGTKEGCNEGDCGACTVVVAKPNGDRLDYRAVNACIQFVATLDGCQLLTVEDLKAADGSLHPVQQAMVDCHGSQCGFCTPGFVMSMFALTRTAASSRTRRRSTTRSRAISAAVPATRRSSARCSGRTPPMRATMRSKPSAATTLERLRALHDDETIEIGDGRRRFIAPATGDALRRRASGRSPAPPSSPATPMSACG